MEPDPVDKTPTRQNKWKPPAVPKPYVTPKLTEHGKLPVLTLGGSLTDA
jgi:hypothetical protein